MKDEIQDTTESIRGMKLGYHLLNYLLIDVITAQSWGMPLQFSNAVIYEMQLEENAGL